MKIQKLLTLGILLLSAVPAWSGSAAMNENVHVMAPFARAVPKVMKNGAVYMVLHNISEAQQVLTEIKGDIAEHIGLHQSLMANGMMKMQPVKSLVIPPNAKFELKPGGYHIMLMGLKRQLREGENFQLTLYFSDGSSKQIKVPVQGLGAMSAPMPMQMHQHQQDPKHNHQKQPSQGG